MSDNRAHFLDAALRIGRRLCRDAIWSNGRCNWLGWAMEPRGGQWVTVYRTMGSLVYDGTAGIGLFLARLAHATQDPIICTTAKAALAQALTSVDALSTAGEYGFYSGLSGIAWCCAESGALLAQDELVARGVATPQVPAQPFSELTPISWRGESLGSGFCQRSRPEVAP
jgi:lantibiotic biosynthesis protein